MDTDEVEFEDGELESDLEDDSQVTYVPLPRPVPQAASLLSPAKTPLSEEEEDSDSETPSKRPYSRASDEPSNGGGEVFTRLARQFQESRKKKNNVWGSILQEESLTSDLSSIGVSAKTTPLSFSDRGSETYDFSLKESSTATNKEDEESKLLLNRELDDYFRKDPPSRRKRSIKDRLGHKASSSEESPLDNMSIPPPGVARIIPDLSGELLEKGSLPEIAEDLAAKLCEPKTELISGVLGIIGIPLALDLFQRTRDIEREGGKMIKSGRRRRTPGGLFLQLLREQESGVVDQEAIKELFNVSSAKKKKVANGKNFEAELKEFRELSQSASKEPVRTPEPFLEPEAPPNSVERPGTAVEEDELNCDSLDIELS